MNNQIILPLNILVIFLVISHIAQATIWRVNSDPVAAANFLNIQSAHDAANPGDTLFVEPSIIPYSYSSSLSKKLIIVGVGYFLNQNYPEYLINSNVTSIGALFLNSGSEQSTVIGLSGTFVIRTINITILHASGTIEIGPGAGNIEIAKCMSVSITRYNTVDFKVPNVMIHNSVISSINISPSFDVIFFNNIIKSSINTGTAQTIFYNNILYTNASIYSCINCTFSNNIDASGSENFAFGNDNGNQGGFVASVVFVNSGTDDEKYVLRAGSPAIGAGINGEDCGIFGGETPYRLSGLAPIPFFTQFEKPGVANDKTPLRTTISIQANH